MMKQKKCFLILTSFLLALVFVLAQPNFAKALIISHPVIDISGNPGQVLTQKVTIENDLETPQTLYSSIYDFKSDNKDGNPVLTPMAKGEGADLDSWIKVDAGPIVLQPKEYKDEIITINIPANADPGGHYAAVLWGNQPEDNSGNVTVNYKTGHLILLKVSGDIQENARITEFTTNQGFYSSLPVNFSINFRNDGNVHMKPVGQIEIYDTLGVKSDTVVFNKKGGSVLPKSARVYSDDVWVKDADAANNNGGFFSGIVNEWKNFGFGRYVAHVNIVYGDKQNTFTDSTAFWVIPWRLILIFIILVLLLVFGIKKYNKMIIEKAKKHSK